MPRFLTAALRLVTDNEQGPAEPGPDEGARPLQAPGRERSERGASPNSRWVLTGPFAEIHDRADLLEDLAFAVRPKTEHSVLALFGFKGLKECLEAVLETDDNRLLGGIAKSLAAAAGPAAVLYEPRRGDFCGVFGGRLETLQPQLEEIVKVLDHETQRLGLETVLTAVELPGEAHTPVGALNLADQRRRAIAGDLRPVPRLSLSSRIAAAIGEPVFLSDIAG
jgi:hypothetical protein